MFRNVKKELIAIPAQMSYLSQVRDFIEHIGRKHKYTDKVINSFKLVIEEACTNIIRHGYRDIKGGEITIKAIIRRQSLTIVIIDQGISFDPRQASTPDLQKYIQIGKKGGLGIFMMRKLMDDVQYNITSRGNELRLTKQREIVPHSRPIVWWEGLTMRTRHTIQASAAILSVAAIVFILLNSNISRNTINDVIETARSYTLSLADNSSEPLQQEKELDLFEFAISTKNSNPEIIYETFITDLDGDIVSSSTTIKALGKYELPADAEIIEKDTLDGINIYNYLAEDSLVIYDFQTPVYANPNQPSPIIGWVHIWVPEQFVLAKINSTRLRILLYMVGILIVIFVGSYFLIDRIVAPFHSLADWVRDVGQGNVDEDEIDIDASDELGEIAQAFNMMTSKFREAQVSLIEQQRLQKELQVAQEIQQMLLPSDFPQVQGYELASFYEAAKEVGGDLFDFVEVDNDTIGICVADVAGKGVPGSLIMTMIRTALRLEARGNKNPADVLARVNRFVTDDMKRGMFVTMFYLVLDSRNRIIHYASAGHNPMILYRGSTKQTYYLNPSGFPVGIQLPDISLFDQKIELDSIRLREDDMLVLYTDGVTEAMNTKRELYREERFLDAVRKNSHFEVSEFNKAVRDDIKGHTQNYPQNDDITYVAIKEKLMQGEVIYSIQKELFRLIEEEGITVKDACEQMQVSPYMYRKYKKIKDSVGLEGLKDFLYETDYIEKKHLSMEVKTRLYDVIRKHPEYGAKRISDELNTKIYGFTKLDPSRIYDELKKAKLNTKEKRENYIIRGGKKRIKPPGTPLMTLDGQVILDYQSAEQVIAERRGKAPPETKPEVTPPPVSEAEQAAKVRIHASKQAAATEEPPVQPEKVEEKEAPEEKPAAAEVAEHVQSEPEKVEAADEKTKVLTQDAVEEEEAQVEDQTEAPDKEAVEEEISVAAASSDEIPAGPEEESEDKKPEAEPELTFEEYLKVQKSEYTIEGETETKESKEEFHIDLEEDRKKDEPLIIKEDEIILDEDKIQDTQKPEIPDSLAIEEAEIKPEMIETFYRTVNDDLKIIEQVIGTWKNGEATAKDLSKIKLSLKIMSTHPLMKKMLNVKQLFIQVHKGIDLLAVNISDLAPGLVVHNAKEMLKYIEKENILKNKDFLLEQINEIGVKQHELRSSIVRKASKNNSDLYAIRKKIAQKNLIKNVSLLESIQKQNRG